MSLLFYTQIDDAVQIVTDTLVSDGDRNPVLYHHKVSTFPQLNMVGVVTGFGSFGYQFFSQIEFIPRLSDIEEVNETAPAILRVMYKAWQEYHAPEEIGTSTVYLFGFPEGSDRIVRYIYRSTKDFVPERHEGMSDTGVKPAPQQFKLVAPETPQEIVDLAVRIREENDELRTPGPVAIGGDLFVTYMDRDRTITERLYRWDDYREMRDRMPDSVYKPGATS